MDKIFKNDTVMGIIAIATLVLVACMFFKCRKGRRAMPETTTASQPETTTASQPETTTASGNQD